MAASNKKHLSLGLGLSLGFVVVLVTMFLPLFKGTNAFHASDRLFNSIAKHSTYSLPVLLAETQRRSDESVLAELKLEDPEQLALVRQIAEANGVKTTQAGQVLRVEASLTALAQKALRDSEDMFHNRGQPLESKYGLEPKKAMYAWWLLLQGLEREFKSQKKFETAKYLHEVITKGVEVGYNFYGIEPTSAKSRAGTLSFVLIFYVVYTLWWGFAIFFIFEGMGLAMTKGTKKEV